MPPRGGGASRRRDAPPFAQPRVKLRCTDALDEPDLSRAVSVTGEPAGPAEPWCREPVPRVDAARIRSDERREATRVRGLSGPRVSLDDRDVLARVVADPEPCIDLCTNESHRHDRQRRTAVRRRRLRRHDLGRQRICVRRTLRVLGRDVHPQAEADVGRARAVRLAGGPDNDRAGRDVEVAALPLIRERGRAAGPRSLVRRQLVTDLCVAGDGGPHGVPWRRARRGCSNDGSLV